MKTPIQLTNAIAANFVGSVVYFDAKTNTFGKREEATTYETIEAVTDALYTLSLAFPKCRAYCRTIVKP